MKSYHDFLVELFKCGQHVYRDKFKKKILENGKVEVEVLIEKQYQRPYYKSALVSSELYYNLSKLEGVNVAHEIINFLYFYSHGKIISGDSLFKELDIDCSI